MTAVGRAARQRQPRSSPDIECVNKEAPSVAPSFCHFSSASYNSSTSLLSMNDLSEHLRGGTAAGAIKFTSRRQRSRVRRLGEKKPNFSFS